MKVRPARAGEIIRDPHTKRPLADEGGDVPETSYWLRRVMAGDVVRMDAPDALAPAPTGLEPVTPLTTRKPRG